MKRVIKNNIPTGWPSLFSAALAWNMEKITVTDITGEEPQDYNDTIFRKSRSKIKPYLRL